MANLDWDSLSDKAGGMSKGIGVFLKSIFGSKNERVVQDLIPMVKKVGELESWAQSLSEEQIRQQTEDWKTALKKGETNLDAILPQAFALVREAAKRTIGLRHFDVQILGGIVLHQGKIAEMSTGEGKTLVATLAAYLNALEGKGCFVVTVNDYLAGRDRDWMAPVYEYLGLKVGAIQSDMAPSERQPQYEADITYGTNNEFGFDYLRDNMKGRVEDQVQKYLHYAIIDEVDSILIDEARTPLIISGPATETAGKYAQADQISRRLKPGAHFEIKEKEKIAPLTDEGVLEAERLAGVDTFYSGANMDWPHLIETSLRAHHLYKKDREYVVKDGEIIIVDEFTGRLMAGRRWSDGLHQAVEAKEGIKPREENQTLATITFQNYFRLFNKISGMTGTAMTEAAEFAKIYNLDVVSIPTNKPNIRKDDHDVVYRTAKEKYRALIEEIVAAHETGQPLLVGTVSIEKSETISEWLNNPVYMREWVAIQSDWAMAELDRKGKGLAPGLQEELRQILSRPAAMKGEAINSLTDQVVAAMPKSDLADLLERLTLSAQTADAVAKGIPNNVLNAKNHDREAQIVAQAGRVGAVTIATNMAGRGTDILLGGNPEALLEKRLEECEEKPSEDQIQAWSEEYKEICHAEQERVLAAGGLCVIGTERHEARRIDNQLRGRCARQGDPGASKFFLSLEDDLMRIFYSDGVTRLMERLGMTEGQDITSGIVSRAIERAQKKVESRHFEARRNLLEYDEVMDKQRKMIYEQRQEVLEGFQLKDKVISMMEEVLPKAIEQNRQDNGALDLDGLAQWTKHKYGVEVPSDTLPREPEELEKAINDRVLKFYADREAEVGDEGMRMVERVLLLHSIDNKWKDHLYAMDALREGIGLRGYAQVDPKNEYKKEGYKYFQNLLDGVAEEVTNYVLRVQIGREDERRLGDTYRGQKAVHPAAAGVSGAQAGEAPPPPPPGGGRASTAFDAFRRGRSQQEMAANRNLSKEARGPARSAKPAAGRNDPCPCGSGKKFKKCHGKAS